MKRTKSLVIIFMMIFSLSLSAQHIGIKYDSDLQVHYLYSTLTKERASSISLLGGEMTTYSYDGVYYYVLHAMNDMYGVVASTNLNQWLIPPQYTEIKSVGSFANYGFFAVRRKGDWGIMDNTGKIVVPLQYKFIGNSGENAGLIDWNDKETVMILHDLRLQSK